MPIIQQIGFHNNIKPIIDSREKTVQYKKSKLAENTGNILFKNIKTPKGIIANPIITLKANFKRKRTTFNNACKIIFVCFNGYQKFLGYNHH